MKVEEFSTHITSFCLFGTELYAVDVVSQSLPTAKKTAYGAYRNSF